MQIPGSQHGFNGSTHSVYKGGRDGSVVSELGQLPTVTAEVVESAVLLAKAEAKLALVEARQMAKKAIVAVAWVIAAGFLLHAAVVLLVLGPLLSLELSTEVRWALIGAPFLLAVAIGGVALHSLRTLQKYEP